MPPKKRKRGDRKAARRSGDNDVSDASRDAMVEDVEEDAEGSSSDEDDSSDEGDSSDDGSSGGGGSGGRARRKQTTAVKEVMGMCVDEKAKDCYANENADFALYLFYSDLKEELLEEWFINGLENAKNVAGSNKKRQDSAMRKYAKSMMLEVHEDEDNCPIYLKKMGFEVYSEYLSARTPKRGKNKGKLWALSKSVYDKSRSGLVHLYRMSRTKRKKKFNQKLKQFLSGISKKVTNEKVKRGDAGRIGKKKMDFAVYKTICEKMMEEEDKEFIFARLFLILEWNLMARSESVVHAHVNHITWSDDAIIFHFAKTKTDPFGKRSEQKWHVYSTPDCPATCPVLAMAQYIFSFPGTFCGLEEDGAEKMRLFPGTRQYDRFMYCLHQIVDKYTGLDEDDQPKLLTSLGIAKGDLGSHSARKGACSFVASGSTASPPIVAICLRACWSLGPVKERYLHYEAGGDQYTGQVVSGRNMLTVEFAKSPPYFHVDANKKREIVSLIRSYMINGDRLPASRLHLLQFLLASLCYHRETLNSKLHPKNQLRSSVFFNSIPPEIIKLAEVRLPWESEPGITPTITGQPTHISIMVNQASLEKKVVEQADRIIQSIKEEMDQRHIGSQSHLEGNRIIETINERFATLLSHSRALPLGQVDDGTGASASAGGNDDSFVEVESRRNLPFRFRLFLRADGSFSRLPENYVMPSMGLASLITRWHCGDPSEMIVPFKLLKPHEMKGTGMKKSACSDMKKLMDLVHEAAGIEGIRVNWRMNEWTVPKTVRLHEGVSKYFNYDKSTDGRGRKEQLAWKTVLNHHYKHKGFANADE